MISVLIAATLLAQQVAAPLPLDARVEGTVINGLTGEPLRKCTVILHARDEDQGVNYADETDGNGNFAIGDIRPGEYGVTAQHVGFFEQSSGAAGAPPPSIKVDKGQQVSGVVLRLAPAGAIAGRVLDADGDPVLGALIRALRPVYTAGRKQLTSVEQARPNANGEFRLFGLRAGSYYLQASYLRPRRRDYPEDIAAYYPGSADESHATPIVLRAGAQLRGLDIRLQQAGQLYSIHFKFPDGHALEGGYDAVLVNQQGVQINHSASFSQTEMIFPSIPPGSYEAFLHVFNGEKQIYAIQHVEVSNADVDGGTLTFLPPAEISGTVRMEGGTFSGFEKLHVDFHSQYQIPSLDPSSAQVKPDGSFVVKDAAPLPYEIAISGAPGVYMKAVRMGDKQLTERRVDLTTKAEPIVVVLATDVGQLEGSVHNAKGEPAVRVRVTAIASGDNSGRADLSRFAFTDEKGAFTIKDLPPGDYKIFAWEDVPEGAPQDPEFRKPFEKQAVVVRMQPNGREKVHVTAIPAAAIDNDDQ